MAKHNHVGVLNYMVKYRIYGKAVPLMTEQLQSDKLPKNTYVFTDVDMHDHKKIKEAIKGNCIKLQSSTIGNWLIILYVNIIPKKLHLTPTDKRGRYIIDITRIREFNSITFRQTIAHDPKTRQPIYRDIINVVLFPLITVKPFLLEPVKYKVCQDINFQSNSIIQMESPLPISKCPIVKHNITTKISKYTTADPKHCTIVRMESPLSISKCTMVKHNLTHKIHEYTITEPQHCTIVQMDCPLPMSKYPIVKHNITTKIHEYIIAELKHYTTIQMETPKLPISKCPIVKHSINNKVHKYIICDHSHIAPMSIFKHALIKPLLTSKCYNHYNRYLKDFVYDTTKHNCTQGFVFYNDTIHPNKYLKCFICYGDKIRPNKYIKGFICYGEKVKSNKYLKGFICYGDKVRPNKYIKGFICYGDKIRPNKYIKGFICYGDKVRPNKYLKGFICYGDKVRPNKYLKGFICYGDKVEPNKYLKGFICYGDKIRPNKYLRGFVCYGDKIRPYWKCFME